ncbi:MAG: myo-inositol 2-dehydrogenase/D-chiro-inositol 1-dehydrogenase, partial [Rhodothermales bacterium]
MSNESKPVQMGQPRRHFLSSASSAITAAAVFQIVPRHVLGGQGYTPPSETLGGALIGCGGRGNSTFAGLGKNVKRLASCDVKYKKSADNKTLYSDFRRVLERSDIDVVAIATPPHWHALITIAAMQAGKDVLCEKPLTRFIAEGRAVVNAEKRYGRILQLGTYGRYGNFRNRDHMLKHKLMTSGLLTDCKGVHIKRGGLKVKQWSGYVNPVPQAIPDTLDWDMYCGPSPLRPFHPHRHGGSHRGYWDYEGGGLADMGQHHFDPVQWSYGKDHTSPVEIVASGPPADPLACGMWGWVELRYADGFTFVMDSREWGPGYNRMTAREPALSDLSVTDQKKILAMPDPAPWPDFEDAVKTRQPLGRAEAAHRSSTLLHLANIAIRTGRKIQYDPIAEQ